MAGIKGKSGRKDHSTGEKAGRKIGTAEKTKKFLGIDTPKKNIVQRFLSLKS